MKYTVNAGKVIKETELSASLYSFNYINPKNLLVGFMKVTECQAFKILSDAGLTIHTVNSLLYNTVNSQQYSNSQTIPTLYYDKILKRAKEFSELTNQDKISTAMMLLGLVEILDELPDILEFLETNFIDREDLMEAAIDVLGENEDSVIRYKEKSLNRISNEMKDIKIEKSVTNGNYKRPLGSYSQILSNYSTNLTEKARMGKLDPVIGREKELNRVIQILGRKTKNNPVLIGDPGVGKTSIAEALALKLETGDVPDYLRDKVIYSLNLGSLVAGAKYRGEFEERLKKVIDECLKKPEILLFVDEVHTVVGSGKTDGSLDGANILKPYLSDGTIQMIGATTIDEYRKIIETDRALERRFQQVKVMEPTENQTLEILHGLKDSYEQFHKVKITDQAINAAVKLSVRYLTDRFLPDKAIDVLDEAASAKKICKDIDNSSEDTENNRLISEYEELYNKKSSAILNRDLNEAINIRNEILNKFENVDKEDLTPKPKIKVVEEEDICKVIAAWTHIPVSKMNEDEKSKLLNMENIMKERIIGQSEAIESICTAIRRNSSGLRDPKKPIASFMFLGSTGVGKTETVKVLARTHYGTEDNIIRLDMSEYMEKHSVSRLIGSPPGYVGHDDGGFLTNAVRTKPYSIILFDEIEKAHPDVFNILLQVLDDGRLTDSKGRVVDFKNTIIIMTSNLGFQKGPKVKEKNLGFAPPSVDKVKQEEDKYTKMKENTLEACRKHFRPEFLNRVDEIIVFHSLTEDNIKAIVRLLCSDIMERLEEKNITLTLTDEVVEFLVNKGTNLEYGARPLSRAIQKYLMDELSVELLSDSIVNGDNVIATVKEEQIVFKVVEKEELELESEMCE